MNIDLMSLSGHKVYGPKGIGACYVRRKPRVRLEPIISGGGQERGLRSGTVPAPLVVGFGEACRLAKNEMAVGAFLPSCPVCWCEMGGCGDDDGGASMMRVSSRRQLERARSTAM